MIGGAVVKGRGGESHGVGGKECTGGLHEGGAHSRACHLIPVPRGKLTAQPQDQGVGKQHNHLWQHVMDDGGLPVWGWESRGDMWEG